jgi:hypothetical protein
MQQLQVQLTSRRPATARLASVALLSILSSLACGDARAEPEAPAGPPDALAAARSLFAEALRDENARRFDVALDKFRRVRGVRDTAAIEYRIGSCLEGLHEAATAYGAYQSAVAIGRGDPAMADVVAAARLRLDELSRHVARLKLSLPQSAPTDLEVRVDGTYVPRDAMTEPLALEPGPHVVVATSKSSAAFRSEITLPEGGQASLTPTGTAVSETAGADAATAGAMTRPDDHGPARGGGARRTAGTIAVATGGGLLVGSLVALLLRNADIASLDRSCPAGQCPTGSNQSELESTRGRALAEGPIAATLAATGGAAAGVGLYLLLGRRPRPPVGARASSTGPLPPFASVGTASWVLSPSLVRDGMAAGVTGSF